MSQLVIERVVANGDCALTLYFVSTPDRSYAIHKLCDLLLLKPLAHLSNVIPAITDITLVFDQVIIKPQNIVKQVEHSISLLDLKSKDVVFHEIPVCYHPDVAMDLTSVCQQLNLTVDELITLHTKNRYQVSMMGFLPGFAYLDGSDENLQLPRKATPSLQVPAGSIAIAGRQTGLYALNSPGGWHVIGRTPLKLLDWERQNNPMRVQPLDQVKFKAISLSAFEAGL
jgi:inhibitor of KinA